ncbi:MAG: hypothetical protein DSM106950_13370 [Stigonema ocellatum SAG 48.90 = DSM 106950]|nr:hypothetical protein [Stigonema ocellatum SAG 48.90 = DSM 106950]
MLIAYLLPVTLLLWFIASFSVNVPFGDDWALANFFDKVASGSANFTDFFAQHNEHRIFFPKIIFLILAFSSKWDLRLEMYFSIFLAIVSFCAMYRIAANSQNQDSTLFHLFNIVTCILAFSLVQSENWLWGFQIAWFFINTCVTLAVFFLVVPKKLLPTQRLSLSALCCFIASFSSAHGLLSWIALIPTVASVEGSVRQRKFRLLLWLVLFCLSLFIYLIGYVKPSYHPDIFFFLKEPLIAVTYLLTLLGKSVGKVIIPSVLVGLIIAVNFVLFNIYYIKNYKSELAHDATPWLSLGWFATLFALMTTLGRAGFGIEQAKSSRYTSVSILLVISLLQILRLLIYHKRKWISKNIYKFSSGIFFVCFLTAIFNSSDEIAQARQNWRQRTRGEACLEVIRFIDKSINQQPDNCLDALFPDPDLLKQMAEPLQRIGFRDFPRNITFTTEPVKNHGYIDTPPTTNKPLIVPKNGKLKLSGWAILPEQRSQPKIVFLSYDSNQSFFANAVVKLKRPDVAKSFNSDFYKKSGWEVNVSPNSIPLRETLIKAWVYDPDHKQFMKLSGEVNIKVVE